MVSKLQSLSSFWQEFGLPSLQGQLDEVATQITSRQDDSEVSRKALIDLMREFRRDNDEVVRAAVAPLVKAFQNEVDSLSKRSKAAEKAFFDVYKKLADAADPVPVLEHALEAQKSLSKMQDMEIETKQLRETIGDYNKEIQEYKTKEKKMLELQAKVEAYDKNIDEALNVKIKDVTEQMLEEYNEKLRIIEEEKLSLARKNADLETKLRTHQKQLQETQGELFDALNGKEEKKDAKSEEVEILLNDLELSNHRAATAEKELEMLRERLTTMKEEASLVKKSREEEEEERKVPDLSRELSAKEREVQQLIGDLHRVKAEKSIEQKAFEERIIELETDVQRSAKIISGLETKLERQSDYETVKKDLSIMKSLEFPQEFAEESKRPLEVMILERSKVLQTENTTLRVEKDKIAEDLLQTKRELCEKNREFERHQLLISELEGHVEQLQEMSNSNRGEAEGRSSADILVDLTPGMGNRQSQSPEQEKESSVKALLPIVQAQRERFRQRNEELEDEQSRLSDQITLLQGEVKDLRGDNVKLYEKIRYLRGFQKDPESSVTISAETRYQNHYEQKMDPFSSFSQQERQKRYGQLNVFEKIILSFVQFMMSNKFARIFVFAYSVLLHILVFTVLMKFAYHDAYRRDLAAEWHDKYIQHMDDAHGSSVNG